MKRILIGGLTSVYALYVPTAGRDRSAFLRPLFWALLAACWLGMNYLPSTYLDGFPMDSNLPYGRRDAKVEPFDPFVAQRFRSTGDLYKYVVAQSKTHDKREMLNVAAKLLRFRFIHAYGVYTLQENWIAVLMGHYIWRDLSAKVIADDIMSGEAAACSQVSLVFMDFCSKLHVPTRKVALKGHYTMEALVEGKWYFFDLDMKPDFAAIGGRKSLREVLSHNEQYRLYANTIADSADVRRIFSSVQYGAIDETPAPRAAIFHQITKHLSHWGWIVPLLIALTGIYRIVRYLF